MPTLLSPSNEPSTAHATPWRSETPDEIYARAVDNEARDNHADAADLYQEAAIRGHLSAMVALGRHLIGLDDRTSVGWFRAAAERGHPTAWTELGHMYARGYGVERSNPHAVMCWQRGATLGDNAARSCLGLSYIQGFGVERDVDRGISIVKEIADSGDVISMRNLAWVYRTGRGVPKDLEQADYWDSRAAEAASSSDVTSQPQLHPPTAAMSLSEKTRKSSAQTQAAETGKGEGVTSLGDEEGETSKLDDGVAHADDDVDPSADKPSAEVASTTPYGEDERHDSELGDEPIPTRPETLLEEALERQHVGVIDSSSSRQLSEQVVKDTQQTKPTSPAEAVSPRKQIQPGVTYLKLVPISSSQETTYIATETTEGASDESAHPVIAVVKDSTEGSGTVSSTDNFARRGSLHATPDSSLVGHHSVEDRETPKRSVAQVSLPRKGSFWGSAPGQTSGTASGLEIVETALTKIQSTSSKSSLGRSSFTIPHIKVNEVYPPHSPTELESPSFAVQHVEERPVLRPAPEIVVKGTSSFTSDIPRRWSDTPTVENKVAAKSEDVEKEEEAVVESVLSASKEVPALEETPQPESQPEPEEEQSPEPEEALESDVTTSALDYARRTIRRHSLTSPTTNGASTAVKAQPVAASSTHRQPVENLIPHFEQKQKEDDTPKPSVPPPPPPPPPPPRPPSGIQTNLNVPSSPSVPAPPPPVVKTEREVAGLMQEIKSSLSNYPKSPTEPDARQAVYNFVDAVQRLRAEDQEEGEFLVRRRAWDLVVVSMFAQPQDVVIQERSLHAFIRLLRFIPEDAKEAAVLRSCRESLDGAGYGEMRLPLGVADAEPGSLQSVLFAMKMYPSTRLVQMAGCAAIADLAEVSTGARVTAVELGAITQIAASLDTRGGNVMATVFEMACRAVSGICSGPDLVRLKQAMAEQRIVEEVVHGLNRGMATSESNDDYLLFATRSGCAAIRHLCTACTEASRHALSANVFETLTKVLKLYQADSTTCTITMAATIAVSSAAADLAEEVLEESEILTMVLTVLVRHTSEPLLVRKGLMCLETLGAFKNLQKRAVDEGAIGASVDVAKEHNDPRVQEQACSTIERLCHCCPAGKDAVASSNAMHTIFHAMRMNPSDIGVMERAALAASSTCTNHPVNQNSALQLGLTGPIVNALGVHGRQSGKLVIACSTAITALAQAKDPLMGRKMAREEAPEYLLNAIRSHMDSADVVEHASYALATLCVADTSLASKLSDQDVEKTILLALKTHIASSRCVLAILSAIRVLVSKPAQVRTRFMTDQSTGIGLAQLLHMALAHHMDPFPESNMVVLVCGTLNFLAFECVPHKNEIGRTGIFEQLGEMIEVSSRDVNVVGLQPSLAAICTLVLNSSENQDRFMNMNGVELILGLMKKWHRNPKVLEHCCIALRYSCNQHAGNCEDVKRLHGVKQLNSVMRSHFNNPRLFEMSCLALAVLCQADREIQESPTVSEAIKATCEAMHAFPEDGVIQVAGCTMFLSATFENEANKKRVVRYGGRTAIVKALESHPGNIELAEAGAYALVHVENVEIDMDDSGVRQRSTEGIKPSGRNERRGGRLKKTSSQNRLSRRKSRDVNRDQKPAQVDGGVETAQQIPTPKLQKSRSRRRRKDKDQGAGPSNAAGTTPAKEGGSRAFLRFGRSRSNRKISANLPDQPEDPAIKEEKRKPIEDTPVQTTPAEYDQVREARPESASENEQEGEVEMFYVD